jgi:hypothetical protein|tara:strand:- start:555 stop:761 length:207 start_codon:yes stop_codon:yes gene_type:complete
MSRINKSQLVLDHLKKFGFIDTWTAIEEYKATRLSSIIYNLRERGYDIESVWVEKKDQARYVMYTLIK